MPASSNAPSHYATLEVASDACAADVRLAYRRAAQRHHPDRSADAVEAQERMARINEAYAVLSHPQRRASYDQWLQARNARLQAEVAARAARPSRFAASWPWGLVAATAAFAFFSVGTVVYKTSWAASAIAAKAAAPQAAGGR
jgi:DnaJ-class molecular chaperone